jgi:hypothetical protein
VTIEPTWKTQYSPKISILIHEWKWDHAKSRRKDIESSDSDDDVYIEDSSTIRNDIKQEIDSGGARKVIPRLIFTEKKLATIIDILASVR